MKAWKRLWRRMTQPSPPINNALDAAREKHISDLRVLIDQGAARERELASMIRMVMEERFYRPVITRNAGIAGTSPAVRPALPIEALDDVATYDEAADVETVKGQDDLAKQAAAELADIFREEAEWRQQNDLPPIEADA
jgi:hypothetical protein